jgi:DNA-binding XRE family transcriptional regulator
MRSCGSAGFDAPIAEKLLHHRCIRTRFSGIPILMSRYSPGPLSQAIAENMRRIRRSRGLSQEELGRLIGMHRTRIGMFEQGRGNPTLGSVDKLAAALGVTPLDLVTQRSPIDEAIEAERGGQP